MSIKPERRILFHVGFVNPIVEFCLFPCLYLKKTVQDDRHSDLGLAVRHLVPEVPRPKEHSVQNDAQHEVLQALVPCLK